MTPIELLHALQARRPTIWLAPRRPLAEQALDKVRREHDLDLDDIRDADARLRRWAPVLEQLFPELAASRGVIESRLDDLVNAAAVTGVTSPARMLVKADHDLPVAGSVKARGGIHEVLAHAEELAVAEGLMPDGGDPRALLSGAAREQFARHTICVGSTGNLGLSIGIMAAALGFQAVVHMSHDAKEWKKRQLRAHGVTVVEHGGDYSAAVAAGRREAQATERCYFVDDENSRRLFLGYAVAALRLRDQLWARDIPVGPADPLFVYLPCGVGGAPGGITFGLKHLFGDDVHCFFAEPCEAPAVLMRLALGRGPASVFDIGLDNRTVADGLAVAQASELVHALVHELVDGVYTASDEQLLIALAALHERAGLRVEPSAAAAFTGLRMLQRASAAGRLAGVDPQRGTHIFWSTGGRLVPDVEFFELLARGAALSAGAD